MSNKPIVSRFSVLGNHFRNLSDRKQAPDLHELYQHPDRLPDAVRKSPEAWRCLQLLGPLAWDRFPERDLQRNWGQDPTPYAAFAAACLYKLDRQIHSMAQLRQRLLDYPELASAAGPTGSVESTMITS